MLLGDSYSWLQKPSLNDTWALPYIEQPLYPVQKFSFDSISEIDDELRYIALDLGFFLKRPGLTSKRHFYTRMNLHTEDSRQVEFSVSAARTVIEVLQKSRLDIFPPDVRSNLLQRFENGVETNLLKFEELLVHLLAGWSLLRLGLDETCLYSKL